MKLDQVMKELRAAGTAQNRKIYARHGVTSDMFGVSYANLKKLAGKIKTDQEIALGLWDTENHDARVLATMVADPQALNKKILESWIKGVDCYVLGDALSGVAAKSPAALPLMKKWMAARKEWVGQVGWNMLCHAANCDDSMEDDEFAAYIPLIEASIHQAKNRVRYAMNGALIAIGMRSPALGQAAIAAAERIGPVDVDHGETSCKTPDAASYIKQASQRRKKAVAGRSAAKKSRKTTAGK